MLNGASFRGLSDAEVAKALSAVEDSNDALAAQRATAEASALESEVERIDEVEGGLDANAGSHAGSNVGSNAGSGSGNASNASNAEKQAAEFEKSIQKADQEAKTVLKAWAGKNSEHLIALEKALPAIQRRSIRFKEVCEPIPEVTPEALRAELEGLEEEEKEWEEEQVEAMKQAEEEIKQKDQDPTPLEATGVGTISEMAKAYASYRKDIKGKIEKAMRTGKIVI